MKIRMGNALGKNHVWGICTSKALRFFCTSRARLLTKSSIRLLQVFVIGLLAKIGLYCGEISVAV